MITKAEEQRIKMIDSTLEGFFEILNAENEINPVSINDAMDAASSAYFNIIANLALNLYKKCDCSTLVNEAIKDCMLGLGKHFIQFSKENLAPCDGEHKEPESCQVH